MIEFIWRSDGNIMDELSQFLYSLWLLRVLCFSCYYHETSTTAVYPVPRYFFHGKYRGRNFEYRPSLVYRRVRLTSSRLHHQVRQQKSKYFVMNFGPLAHAVNCTVFLLKAENLQKNWNKTGVRMHRGKESRAPAPICRRIWNKYCLGLILHYFTPKFKKNEKTTGPPCMKG